MSLEVVVSGMVVGVVAVGLSLLWVHRSARSWSDNIDVELGKFVRLKIRRKGESTNSASGSIEA